MKHRVCMGNNEAGEGLASPQEQFDEHCTVENDGAAPRYALLAYSISDTQQNFPFSTNITLDLNP